MNTKMRLSLTLLLASMVPLALSISLDFYVVARIILGGMVVPLMASAGILALFAYFWFVLPKR